MGAIGRQCSVVNLDPANDKTSYPCALDIRDLVTLEEIMGNDNLGPNGGVLYALEELEHNFEWLEDGLKELGEDYILFDCPGQVELYTHHNSLRNIFFKLQKLGFRVRLEFAVRSCFRCADSISARCLAPFRQLLPDPAFSLSLEPPPRAPGHDADGSSPHQRPDQDR